MRKELKIKKILESVILSKINIGTKYMEYTRIIPSAEKDGLMGIKPKTQMIKRIIPA
jgi:hypothetical protein